MKNVGKPPKRWLQNVVNIFWAVSSSSHGPSTHFWSALRWQSRPPAKRFCFMSSLDTVIGRQKIDVKFIPFVSNVFSFLNLCVSPCLALESLILVSTWFKLWVSTYLPICSKLFEAFVRDLIPWDPGCEGYHVHGIYLEVSFLIWTGSTTQLMSWFMIWGHVIV